METEIKTYVVVVINKDNTKTIHGSIRHPEAFERANKIADTLRAEGKVVEVVPYIGPTMSFNV